MSKRLIKKLNKRAMNMLIDCGWNHSDDFELWRNDWILYVNVETREESWVDVVAPFSYLTGLVQDTLIDYIEVEDDSELGFHVEQVWDSRYDNLSIIKIFSIFRNTYGAKAL